ncbi:MAG: hypothetical protein JWM19_6918 [Actinomycetia bacterium]|nr:hypothetical protein [Actinomycetes bacterium]
MLYLVILVDAVGELIRGSYLGVTWVLYGVAGFAVAAGLTALAALAGRRGWRGRRWIGSGAAIIGVVSIYTTGERSSAWTCTPRSWATRDSAPQGLE